MESGRNLGFNSDTTLYDSLSNNTLRMWLEKMIVGFKDVVTIETQAGLEKTRPRTDTADTNARLSTEILLNTKILILPSKP